jgi:hypothetical protein
MLVVVKRFILTIGILCVTAAMVTDVVATRRAAAIREALAITPSSRVIVTILSVVGWVMIVGSVSLMLVAASRRSQTQARRLKRAKKVSSTEADNDASSDSSD